MRIQSPVLMLFKFVWILWHSQACVLMIFRHTEHKLMELSKRWHSSYTGMSVLQHHVAMKLVTEGRYTMSTDIDIWAAGSNPRNFPFIHAYHKLQPSPEEHKSIFLMCKYLLYIHSIHVCCSIFKHDIKCSCAKAYRLKRNSTQWNPRYYLREM